MPTTTTGRATDFITFSRPGATGGGATVTDRDGKIKWAGHNLLPDSESFDKWFKYTVTVSANTEVAPNSTTTADTLAADGTNDWHYVRATVSAGFARTFSVFVKKKDHDFVQILFGGDVNAWANFNVANGTKGSVGTNQTESITPVGSSGWYLITVTTSSLTASDAYISLIPSATSARGAGGAFSTGVYLWGAHLYRSDLGGMVLNPARGDAYYPTTVRNMLGFTEDFNSWTKASATVTSNQGIAPNGLETADKLDAGSAAAVFQNNIPVVANTPYTFSVWIRGVSSSGTTEIHFSKATASPDNTTAVNFTTSWQRFTVTGSITSTLGYAQIGTWASRASGPSADILIWGAQLSDSASLDAYSPVYGAAVTSAAYYAPRLDYSGSSLAALGLLVEEQRTNLIPYSNQFEDASWGLAGGVTVVNNPSTITSPDGTSNADRIVPSTSPSSFNYIRRINLTTANVAHTLSVYARASGYNFIELILGSDASYTKFATAYFNVSTGDFVTSRNTTYTVADKTITPVGGGWFRCTLTVVLDATVTTTATFTVGSTTNPTATFTGDGTSGVLFYGAQLEVGASSTAAPFPTSYIPTIGNNTATRTADVASVSTQAFPYSASTQSLVVSYRTFENAGSAGVFSINNTDANRFDFRTNGNVVVTASGSGQLTGVELTMGAAGTINKAGFALAVNDFADVANGGTVKTDTTVTLPAAATIFNLGYLDNHPSAYRLNGHIRQITYIPRRLSNTELQARTL